MDDYLKLKYFNSNVIHGTIKIFEVIQRPKRPKKHTNKVNKKFV